MAKQLNDLRLRYMVGVSNGLTSTNPVKVGDCLFFQIGKAGDTNSFFLGLIPGDFGQVKVVPENELSKIEPLEFSQYVHATDIEQILEKFLEEKGY